MRLEIGKSYLSPNQCRVDIVGQLNDQHYVGIHRSLNGDFVIYYKPQDELEEWMEPYQLKGWVVYKPYAVDQYECKAWFFTDEKEAKSLATKDEIVFEATLDEVRPC